MADVRLDFYDLDAEELPDVCMRCGEPSTVRPVKSFSCLPHWTRFAPSIVGVWFIKRRRVPIPLCERHKGHWTFPRIIGYGIFEVALVLLFAGAALLVVEAINNPAETQIIGPWLILTSTILFIVLFHMIIVLSAARINVVEITDNTITLKNVHSDFMRAYREMTRGSITPEVEEIVREKWDQSSGRRRPERDEPRRDDSPPDDKYRRG
jgi:hypothetical protein